MTTPAVSYTIRGNIAAPVNENRNLYRGSGNLAWALTLDGGAAGGPYSGWTVIREVTWTNPANGVTMLAYTATLTCTDAVNGVFQETLPSSATTSTALPQAQYDERWWRTDLAPDKQLLRYGKLSLLQLEYQ